MRPRILSTKWFQLVGLAGQFEIEAVHQLVIGRGENANRKSTLEAGNPGDCPAIDQLSSGALILGQRRLPVVTDNEAMPGVKLRKPPAAPRIHGIQNALEAGSLVNGLAPGVSRLELKPTGKSRVQAGLQ